MTAEERAAIRERCEKATSGPWTVEHRCVDCDDKVDETAGLGLEIVGPPEPMRGQFALSADARFIAHARANVPALLDALDAAERERDEARAALVELVRDINGMLFDRNQEVTWHGLDAVVDDARVRVKEWEGK